MTIRDGGLRPGCPMAQTHQISSCLFRYADRFSIRARASIGRATTIPPRMCRSMRSELAPAGFPDAMIILKSLGAFVPCLISQPQPSQRKRQSRRLRRTKRSTTIQCASQSSSLHLDQLRIDLRIFSRIYPVFRLLSTTNRTTIETGRSENRGGCRLKHLETQQ